MILATVTTDTGHSFPGGRFDSWRAAERYAAFLVGRDGPYGVVVAVTFETVGVNP